MLPASFSVSSSMVGNWYRSGMMARFTSDRFTQSLRPPSFLTAVTKFYVQGLASTLSMTPSLARCWSSSAIGCRFASGGCQKVCLTGLTDSFTNGRPQGFHSQPVGGRVSQASQTGFLASAAGEATANCRRTPASGKRWSHRESRCKPLDVKFGYGSKKDGGLRLCVNLSDVNRAIIPERYPLLTMDELTEKLAGSTVFSKIDLLWGYLQLELAEDKRYLTSFVTHIGVFRFKRLPFGLASGPSAFHQVIRTILKGLDGCESILDDILVHGRGTVAECESRWPSG